jgi:hypothetical protein
MQTTEISEDLIEVTFRWHTKWGTCYDCGLPAAYYVDVYGVENDTRDEAKFCCVCAADSMADGFPGRRIDPHWND